ncbi:UNVERIFIED_CONTAM: DUF637 domain-containing protein, partial [Acinetobacter pittii]
VNLQSVQVNANQGDILVSSNNGINLKANSDVVVTGDTGRFKTVNNVLKGQTVSIENSKSDIKIQNTDLSSTVGKLAINSRAGMSTIIDSVLTSKGNTELYAKDLLTLQGVNATSDQHLAVSSGRTVYSNAEYTPATKWIADKVTNLTSKGVTSVTATGNQVLQNTNLTGGAVLLEAGGFILGQTGLNLNAVGSDLLKNDTKLNSLNGDLTIQTNSNLTIDPKVYSLKAVGDIELVSKNGTLTLKGYGGTAGNGSEQVVKLDTANGGINLEGAKVDIQGSQLTAQKDIKIVSSKDDVLVDGVKNSFAKRKKEEKFTEANNLKNSILSSLDLLKQQQFFTDYDNMVTAYEDYASSNYDYTLYVKHYNLYKDFISKYPVRPNPRLLIFGSDVPLFHSIIAVPQRSSRFDALYSFEPKYDENYLRSLQAEVDFYNTEINGSEHAEAKLTSKSGNINITSAKGLSISGGNISAQLGQVNLEASGVLAEQYKSTTTTETNPQPRILNASIIVDGHTDFYDKGSENDQNYSMRTLVSPSIINGDKGVNIRTVGKTKDDNLVLQATGITSKNGDVKIESNKSILFDAAIEQSYDRSITTEKKKSWGGLKKKYITTVSENNGTNAASVDISAKNISIETKKLDPSVDAKTPDNNIDIYSGRFTAEGGTISINSGGNLNLYTVEESSRSDVDITKKSSFAGIKYNTSKTNATRTQVTEIPATLKADYIGTKSVYDTKLVGTEFEYLIGSTLEAGGKLELIAAKTSITDLLKKEKNSVVWQSMQDKGSITETAQLPSFNGPVLPTFKAAGGLSVQVPISEKDVNKVELRDAILDLSKKPGNEYLKELVNRKDVDWQTVLLTQKDWDYKSQGLTAAGAAIIVIIVTILTMGSGTAAAAGAAGGTAASGTTVGLGASMIGSAGVTTATVGGVTTITGVSTLGAMANAAITSLATQASVGLINNGGDIGKTLKDLGSKDSVKNLAASVVTAGLLNGVATNLNISSNAIVNDIANNMATGMIQGVGSTLIDSAVNGRNLSEGLEKALLAGLANSLQAPLAGAIGDTLGMSSNAFVSKVVAIAAHAAAGCATGVIDKECQSRALGAALGEVIAENMFKPANGIEYTEAEKSKILNITKLTTGVVAAYVGYDVTAAANAADTAVSNNYLNHVQEKQKSQELKDCNVLTCGGVVVKWAAISAGQDANYAAGFAVGIPTSVAESVVGLAKMALSPIQTYKAIKEVINSENALGNISDAIKQDYTNRINKLESEYEKAGIKGSYNAGLEAGKLTADVASLFAGGASLAKGGVILTEKVAAKVGYKVLKDPIIISDKGIAVNLDGHKIYDPQFTPLSTNPRALYRFSDFNHRSTGGDIYFGENIATSYFEVRQAVNGKSLFVGQVEVKNMLDLTDPKILKQMGIDQKKLTEIAPDGYSNAEKAKKEAIYAYTNRIANQAYDKGYTGIIYNSSRNTGSNNNRAVVLFGGRYDAAKIKPVLDKPILKK